MENGKLVYEVICDNCDFVFLLTDKEICNLSCPKCGKVINENKEKSNLEPINEG